MLKLVLISMLVSLGACATLDPSQRGFAAPTPRSMLVAQSSEPTVRGFARAPSEQPPGPTAWGFAALPAGSPAGPMVHGFATLPAERAPAQAPVATRR